MATAQTAYAERHDVGYAGMIIDSQTCDVRSLQWSGTANGKFGYGCQLTAADGEVMAAVATTRAFAGVLAIDRTLRPVQNDEYVAGDVASVLIRGTILVQVSEAVKPGDLVCMDPSTGQFRTGNPGVNSFVVVSAGSGYGSSVAANVLRGEGWYDTTPGAVTRSGTGIGSIAAPASNARGTGFMREPEVQLTNTGGGTGAVIETRLSLIPIPGARYQTTAVANGLAKVHLTGLNQIWTTSN